MKNWNKLIKAYALKNALEHEGKCQEGAVIAGLFHEGLKREDVKNVIKDVKDEVKRVNSLGLEQQKKEFSAIENLTDKRKERIGLPELPDAGKNIVMRIAPYPSGALHIGNTRQFILNDEYAKMYNGKLFFFIDDTIGSEEKKIAKEAYKLIEEGMDWLEIKYEKPILHKSDRLEIYYKYAEKLIEKGKAYVCFCSQEKLRENRAEGRECEHRKQAKEETLKLWKKMFKMKQGEAVLRIKTSMKDKNPAFRDRVLFRISESEHPRVGKKYKVWPLLEFSWAVDDYLLGMTHIIRGKELMIETEMEKYIFDIFSWKHPVFIHTGLFQIEGVKLSKSKGQKEIQEGRYSSWSDPRTWSLQSLEKRGIQPEAIRKFIIDLGLNQNEITVPIDMLYALNRKILHETAKKADFKENKNGRAVIRMPDNSVIKGDINGKIKDKAIVYFKNIGYCKKNKNEFWLAHK